MLSLAQLRQGFEFHNQTKNLSPKTVEWYVAHLKTFEQFVVSLHTVPESMHLPTVNVGDVTTQDVRQFIAYLQSRDSLFEHNAYHKPIARGLSPFTIHGHVRVLKTFFH